MRLDPSKDTNWIAKCYGCKCEYWYMAYPGRLFDQGCFQCGWKGILIQDNRDQDEVQSDMHPV
jgi:rRNA maturation endonuclease Nob1